MDLLEVKVANLAIDAATKNPVVLLKSVEADEVLPIWIGPAEANAIAMELAGKKFTRPLTHDLLKLAIQGLGARVSKVVVTEIQENTFFAKVYLTRDDDVLAIDARPSDSIALALRANASIFVARDLFLAHKKEVPGASQEEEDDEVLRNYLKDLDPGDFGTFRM
jgi:bifunctional DNase/RNase